MTTDLSVRYSFVTNEAKEAALARRLPGTAVSQMLKVLDLARDVASGSAALFAIGVNEDIFRNSSGADPQIGRTGLLALLSLGQAANEMLDLKLEEMFDEINRQAEASDG